MRLSERRQARVTPSRPPRSCFRIVAPDQTQWQRPVRDSEEADGRGDSSRDRRWSEAGETEASRAQQTPLVSLACMGKGALFWSTREGATRSHCCIRWVSARSRYNRPLLNAPEQESQMVSNGVTSSSFKGPPLRRLLCCRGSLVAVVFAPGYI